MAVDKIEKSDLYCFCHKTRHKKNSTIKSVIFIFYARNWLSERKKLAECLQSYLEITEVDQNMISRLKLNLHKKMWYKIK